MDDKIRFYKFLPKQFVENLLDGKILFRNLVYFKKTGGQPGGFGPPVTPATGPRPGLGGRPAPHLPTGWERNLQRHGRLARA
jgi:hypothetical protein